MPFLTFTGQQWLHKGESLCCFRDSASVTYGGMLPSGLTLSVLRFILFATVSQGYLYACCYASVVEHLLEGVELLESVQGREVVDV